MNATAKRTQIYLPAELHGRAFRYAREKHVSLAAVIRLSLRDFLTQHQQLSKRTYEKDPLWRLLGAAESKDGDLSVWHDHYLYGRPKRAVG